MGGRTRWMSCCWAWFLQQDGGGWWKIVHTCWVRVHPVGARELRAPGAVRLRDVKTTPRTPCFMIQIQPSLPFHFRRVWSTDVHIGAPFLSHDRNSPSSTTLRPQLGPGNPQRSHFQNTYWNQPRSKLLQNRQRGPLLFSPRDIQKSSSFVILESTHLSWTWWLMPVIPMLGMLRIAMSIELAWARG